MKPSLPHALAIFAALTLAGAPLVAQQPEPRSAARTIRVTAVGEARATPDVAHLDFGVETTAATARGASEENAQVMERIIRALTAAGIPRQEIQTRNFSVVPDYARPMPGREEPQVRGYRVSNMVSVRTMEIARVGALIDAALQAGANRVHGVRFTLRDPSPLRAQALRQAVEKARAEAQALASALGVTLGAVLDASTSVESFRGYATARADFSGQSALRAAPTPVEPGEQTVTALVSLVFGIER
jgi:uncharacterized protein YggE